jgi:hypothetical protein
MDPTIRSALVTTIQDEMNMVEDGTSPTPTESNATTDTTFTGSIPTTLIEIEHELQVVQEQLDTAIQKEQFISQRSHTYQKLLDEQASRMKQQQQQQQQQKNTVCTRTSVSTPVPRGDDTEIPESEDLEAGWKNDGCAENEADEVKNPLIVSVAEETPTTIVAAAANSNNIISSTDLDRMKEKWERNMEALESIREIHLQILTSIETLRRQMKQLQQKKRHIQNMYQECTTFIDVATTTVTDDMAVTTTPATPATNHDNSGISGCDHETLSTSMNDNDDTTNVQPTVPTLTTVSFTTDAATTSTSLSKNEDSNLHHDVKDSNIEQSDIAILVV